MSSVRRWVARRAPAGLRWFTFAVLVSGCFNPTYHHPACGENGACPAGLTCDLGFCVDHAIDDAGSEGLPGDGPATMCAGYTSLPSVPGPSLYRVVATKTRFKAAEQACETAPGHLVILDSDEERIAVAAANMDGWVGFSDLKNEGNWIDVSGRPSVYMVAHWAPAEPSLGGLDNCAFLNVAGGLDATNCGAADGSSGDSRSYVCECGDGVQGSTSNFSRD